MRLQLAFRKGARPPLCKTYQIIPFGSGGPVMGIMIPQMVAICNDYFWNTIPVFPSLSTHMRFCFGQNGVTERSSPVRSLDNKNNVPHTNKIRQKYPYHSWTYQNCRVHSDNIGITNKDYEAQLFCKHLKVLILPLTTPLCYCCFSPNMRKSWL